MRRGKKEEGSVLVLVTISLSVLIGMCGFAMDFGLMASTKQHMQNACDAAALAAAADIGDKKSYSEICNTANTYARVNGYNISDSKVSVTTSVNSDTVTVRISKTVNMGLSAVLTGNNTATVSAEATAEVTSIFGGRPYALFAGEKIEDGGTGIVIGGNNINIDGNIHSNSDIRMPHATLSNGSVATAVGSTNPSSSGWNAGAIALDMPAVGPLKNAILSDRGLAVFSSNVVKNSQTGFQELINEALNMYRIQKGAYNTEYMSKGLFIYINGDLIFNGNSATAYYANFPITIIVKGDVDLNGCKLNSTSASPIVVTSETGNIEVNGGGAEFTGILYAPKGDVTLNGNDAVYNGCIVAQNIYKNGGRIKVTYDDDADNHLPKTKVHLIN